MRVEERLSAARSKLSHFGQEVRALRAGGFRYAVFFGFLMVLLAPILVLEIIVLLVFGFDLEIMQTRDAALSTEIDVEEVPKEFRPLIPLAMKWGIGDSETREARIKAASPSELKHLEKEVGPQMQGIADWLDSYSEAALGGSATAGYFIFLQTAYEEVSDYLERYDRR